jgi:transposase, IS30 family
MAVFTESMINEKVQTFWAALARGEFITNGRRRPGRIARRARAGWRPLAGCALAEAGICRAATCRSPSVRRSLWLGLVGSRCAASPGGWVARRRRSHASSGLNADRHGGYRATTAHALADGREERPKPAKLPTNPALRAKVQEYLQQRYSPEQICGRLRVEFPDSPEMRVSAETIYQALYVQSRGALRRDLAQVPADRSDAASARP